MENYRFGHVFLARPGRRLPAWKTTDLITFFWPDTTRPGPTRPEANSLENYRFGHVFLARPDRRLAAWEIIDLVRFFRPDPTRSDPPSCCFYVVCLLLFLRCLFVVVLLSFCCFVSCFLCSYSGLGRRRVPYIYRIYFRYMVTF